MQQQPIASSVMLDSRSMAALATTDELAGAFATSEAKRGVYRGAELVRRLQAEACDSPAERDRQLALADAYQRRAGDVP